MWRKIFSVVIARSSRSERSNALIAPYRSDQTARRTSSFTRTTTTSS